jgi:hypothetical protein
MNWKSLTVQASILSFITAIIGAFIWGFASSYFSSHFNKQDELETRIFEVKEKHYTQFLETYYKYFSQTALTAAYKTTREKEFSKNNNRSSALKQCYATIPRNCMINSWEELLQIKKMQQDIVNMTIDDQRQKVDRETIVSQLMISTGVNEKIQKQIFSNKKNENLDVFHGNITNILREDLEKYIKD